MAKSGLTVLGIAGSLRRASYNRGLLRAAIELAPEGLVIEPYEIGDLPHYSEDLDVAGGPPAAQKLQSAIRAADALLIATPEYNYGLPGALKNAIDWASRPPNDHALRRKPVAIMGASMGMGGTIRAQLALRQTLLFTECYCLLKPEVCVAGAMSRFDASGTLIDEESREYVGQLLEALADWTLKLKAAGLAR